MPFLYAVLFTLTFILLLCNEKAGDLLHEDGSAFRLQQSFWTADSVDEFNKQYVLSIGMYDNTYSVEDMMGVLKSYTPETNFEEFQKFTEK